MSVPASQPRKFRAFKDGKRVQDLFSQLQKRGRFFIKVGKRTVVAATVDTGDENVLRFRTKQKIDSTTLRLFTGDGPFILCEGDVEAPPLSDSTGYVYSFSPQRVLIPEEARRDARFLVENQYYQLGKITYSTVAEEPESISKTIQYNSYIREMRKKLDFFSFVGVYPCNASPIPAEIHFSRVTGSILFIRDLSSYNLFMKKNEIFFNTNPKLKSHLENRLRTLKLRYSSLLVRPIDYLPMVGGQFAIAYVVAARENGEIQNDDILAIDEAALELYNLLTGSFIHEKSYPGRIINLSVTGARLFIEDNRYYEEFSSLSVLSFSLRIIGVADITVSGKLVYLQKTRNGFYLGVQFKRSVFGTRFPKFLYDTMVSHNLSPA